MLSNISQYFESIDKINPIHFLTKNLHELYNDCGKCVGITQECKKLKKYKHLKSIYKTKCKKNHKRSTDSSSNNCKSFNRLIPGPQGLQGPQGIAGMSILGPTGSVGPTGTFSGVVAGDLKVLGNILLPDANSTGTSGVLQFGVDPIFAYNVGTSNFFCGDYTAGMPQNVTTASHNLSLGTNSNIGLSTAQDTIAIGRDTISTAFGSTAMGLSANAANDGAISIGQTSVVFGVDGTSIGTSSQSSGVNAVAIGTNTIANGLNSVCLGAFTTTSKSDAIILGDPTNTNVQVGIGTNSPNAKLDISNTDTANGIDINAGGDGVHVSNAGINNYGLNIDASGGLGIRSKPTYAHPTGNPSTLPLIIDDNGEFGTTPSSIKFKENIRGLNNYSSKLYNLNPVLFDYKKEIGGGRDQFGLIAEEVNEYLPELVVRNDKNEIYTVAYQNLIPLLLNEIIHQKNRIDKLTKNFE